MNSWKDLQIDANINSAETLPAWFYRSVEVFDTLKEKVFLNSWQWLGDEFTTVPLTESAYPATLMEGFLSEPIVLVKDKEEKIRCFSNVCTHRGNIVVHDPGKLRTLSCMYHGRQFALDGKFKFMPEFKAAENFPRPCDHLHEFNLEKLGPFLFAGIGNPEPIQDALDKMMERVSFLTLDEFKRDESLSKDYIVNSHWALYCDNYLEGFHIPFVHKDLNEVLDYGEYTTEIDGLLNLQIGYSDSGQEVFELPEDHPDFGRHVAAYYYWLFPNMMFNFYPWGLSINIVKPLSLNKTRVSFITYIYDETKFENGAGAMIDKVEREDEFVVEGVHKGVRSNFYQSGRFSPSREKGVHQFHRLLATALKD